MDNMLEVALQYADIGWHVFPVKIGGKRPLISKRNGGRGHKDATTDTDTIKGWWERWPNANIGVACGASGLVVLDLDPPDGEDNWVTWADENNVEDANIAQVTPRGGTHLIYTAVEKVRNSAGKFLPNVDVRAAGGYIVVPPSTIGDRGYHWMEDCSPFDAEPDALPLTLEKALKHADLLGEVTRAAGMKDIEDIPSGQRNATLTSMAGGMRRAGMTADEIALALFGVNESRCKPPLEEQEVASIAGSVAHYAPAKRPTAARTPDDAHMTDVGNGIRMATLYGEVMRYCYPWRKWLIWDEKYWAPDRSGEIYRLAKDTVSEIYLEAAALVDDKLRKSRGGWAVHSENITRIKAMIETAQSEEGIPVMPNELDANPYIITVDNGTLDLRTGDLLAHDPNDMVSKMTAIAYDPDAKCPLWQSFLDDIMAEDEEMIAFLQRAMGYCLTGDVSERALFILHGTGDNGKSTFLETLRTLLGDHGISIDPKTLLQKRQNTISNAVARMNGARVIITSETEKGRRLSENLVKALTGNDTITARFLYKEETDFKPQCKLWIGTNHKPEISGTDDAIWNRVKLVPFDVTIPKEEQDKHLGEKLLEELPGILAWAVTGCLTWLANGLDIPDKVTAATQNYRKDMDDFGDFLEAACVVGHDEKDTSQNLWAAFVVHNDGDVNMSRKAFAMELKAHGFVSYSSHGVRSWKGLKVTDALEDIKIRLDALRKSKEKQRG